MGEELADCCKVWLGFHSNEESNHSLLGCGSM